MKTWLVNYEASWKKGKFLSINESDFYGHGTFYLKARNKSEAKKKAKKTIKNWIKFSIRARIDITSLEES